MGYFYIFYTPFFSHLCYCFYLYLAIIFAVKKTIFAIFSPYFAVKIYLIYAENILLLPTFYPI